MIGAFPISLSHVADFHDDGVVCLRNVVGPDWIERLRRAVDSVAQNPQPRALRRMSGDAGRFIVQGGAGGIEGDIRRFAEDPTIRKIAADLMQSRKVTLFNEVIFMKEPRSGATEWHNDYSYMALNGTQICTVWVALDPVTADTGAMFFVRSSNKNQKLYRPVLLGTGRERPSGEVRDPAPDVWARQDEFNLLSYDLNPGDCTVHHAWTLHGTKANMSQTSIRRGIALRYVGGDVERSATQFGVSGRKADLARRG